MHRRKSILLSSLVATKVLNLFGIYLSSKNHTWCSVGASRYPSLLELKSHIPHASNLWCRLCSALQVTRTDLSLKGSKTSCSAMRISVLSFGRHSSTCTLYLRDPHSSLQFVGHFHVHFLCSKEDASWVHGPPLFYMKKYIMNNMNI